MVSLICWLRIPTPLHKGTDGGVLIHRRGWIKHVPDAHWWDGKYRPHRWPLTESRLMPSKRRGWIVARLAVSAGGTAQCQASYSQPGTHSITAT
jgi:hypothetical protein